MARTMDATHDTFGRKLPIRFKMVVGMFALKRHAPTGDEVRVTVFDHDLMAMRHTFRNLDVARPFMNAANDMAHADTRRVVVEWENDKMTLRLGRKV